MAKPNVVLTNSQLPIFWNVVVNSVHIVAYKLWYHPPGSNQWITLSQGVSTDNIADNGSFQTNNNSTFAYWLAIGSTAPGSKYSVSVILSQSNKILTNGLMQEMGNTQKNGVITLLDQVQLL